MGYDTVRFLSETIEEFICAICQSIIQDPVRLAVECDHHFCRICITTWLDHRSTCPVDNIHVTKTNIKPLARTVNNIYDRLRLKCTFENLGCTEIVTIGQLEQHESGCEHNPNPSRLYPCPECEADILMREQYTHNCISHWKSLAKGFMLERDELKKQNERLTQELNLLNNAATSSHRGIIRRHDADHDSNEPPERRRRETNPEDHTYDSRLPIEADIINLRDLIDANNHGPSSSDSEDSEVVENTISLDDFSANFLGVDDSILEDHGSQIESDDSSDENSQESSENTSVDADDEDGEDDEEQRTDEEVEESEEEANNLENSQDGDDSSDGPQDESYDRDLSAFPSDLLTDEDDGDEYEIDFLG